MPKGAVFATMLKRDMEVSMVGVENPKSITLAQAHAKLGHPNIEKT